MPAYEIAGTSGANFWHPAVTEEELASPALLVSNYRRAMGRTRILGTVLGFVVAGVAIDWIRRGAKAQG